MAFPTPRYIRQDGFRLALYEAGPEDGPVLLLIHGWPEMAYSWTHQIEAFAKAGYRVVAMDMRGFGNSDAPKGVAHYGIAQIVGDVEAVLDDIAAKQVVLVGHDWGGIIVWHAARMLQDRVSHVISLCTPHVRRAPADPIKIFRKRHGDEHYFVHFADRPGEADALFASDPDAFFKLMFQRTKPGTKITSDMFHTPARFKAFLKTGMSGEHEAILQTQDRKIYAEAYARTGFHGGLNLYRNTTPNWELAEGLSEIIVQPTLMISARDDLFLPPEFADQMGDTVPDLERHVIEDCGHWMMWEKPEVANTLMLDWLSRRL